MTKGKKISDSLNQTTKGEIPSTSFEAATELQKTRGRVGCGEEGAVGGGGAGGGEIRPLPSGPRITPGAGPFRKG